MELSRFLMYLKNHYMPGERLPPLKEISAQLSISTTTLREQIEVAKSIGVIETKPKIGITCKEYSFTPGLLNSIGFAISTNVDMFYLYADLRKRVESAYWFESVQKLNSIEIDNLYNIVDVAKNKLEQVPKQIPHIEHKAFHLNIYKSLNNVFVFGILEAYWEIYETVGMHWYSDIQYLNDVWNYHSEMVDAIAKKDFMTSQNLLIYHMSLINKRNEEKKVLFE